jgi:adenylate kinase
VNIILLGPPGAGKGTQSARVAEKYNLAHVSTGDIFRETAKSGSELGIKLKNFMSQGVLVPDNVVIEVIKERLSKADVQKGFVLDGFPRTLGQAKELDKVLLELNKKIDKAINIKVVNEEIIERLSNRRICPKCGDNYNLVSNPPKVEGKCDKCSAELIQRYDDNPNVIRERLKVYDEQTKPLIEYYSGQGKLSGVNGSQTPQEVFNEICAVIGK